MCINMLIFMRTTLEIEDEVFRRAKVRAAEAGRTLGELVTAALRNSLDESPHRSEATPFVMPVFGHPSHRLDRSPSSLAELRDDGR